MIYIALVIQKSPFTISHLVVVIAIFKMAIRIKTTYHNFEHKLQLFRLMIVKKNQISYTIRQIYNEAKRFKMNSLLDQTI